MIPSQPITSLMMGVHVEQTDQIQSFESQNFILKFMPWFNEDFPDWPPGARTVNGTALCY
jgi:hypothetical protein